MSEAPSANQIAFAEKIADQLGVPLPDACRDDKAKCGEFIEKNKAALPMGPPTEKKLAFAEKIAAAMGVDLPPECRADGGKCSAFIDANMNALPPAGGGSGSAGAPTEKKLAFAEKIAEAMSVPLPDECRTDWKKCGAFIDANIGALPANGGGSGGGSGGGRAPTEKQISFAEKIAERLGVALPVDVRADGKKCSAWIDANKGK